MRRQALTYPFDGNDLLEDLSPRNARLQPVSMSGRSKGPSMELLALQETDAIGRARLTGRRTAALFNASNHEFFRIPPVYNMFDPSLAVRVMPGQRTLYQGEARKIHSTIAWEQVTNISGVMRICNRPWLREIKPLRTERI
jgi:hypothetical protein